MASAQGSEGRVAQRVTALFLGLALASGPLAQKAAAAEGAQSAADHPVLAETQVVSGKYRVVDDAASGWKVLQAEPAGLVLESRAPYAGALELRALVRLPTDAAVSASAIFRLARTQRAGTEVVFALGASKTTDTISCSATHGAKWLHDPSNLQAPSSPPNWDRSESDIFYYKLRSYAAILPGWPEDFRLWVEHAMAELPDHNTKWLDVRVELRKGLVRFWVDDRLAAQKNDPSVSAEGSVRVELTNGAQLASCHVSDAPDISGRFFPIHLGGYANAFEFLDGASIQPESLPPADVTTTVDGVPFVFSGLNPEGHDHLDIGRSLYREGNLEGYFPAYESSWAGSAWRDPARIQLRVPNGWYDRLYLVAASDDRPDAWQGVTAMFYRPSAGFPERFEGKVPLATARRAKATPFPVTLSNGHKAKLWLVEIPIEPAQLTSLSDLEVVEIELTKKVCQYRLYPDPSIYGWHQGGAPSAAHVYAATLSLAPVEFEWTPSKFGHVWTSPEVPAYAATVTNRTDALQRGELTVQTRSYDGTEQTKQAKPVSVDPGGAAQVAFSVPVALYGYHDITATLKIAGRTWTEKRSFVNLAPDTRAARHTEGQGAMFGFWSYVGGHYTPKAQPINELMAAAGARSSMSYAQYLTSEIVSRHWSRFPCWAGPGVQPWAGEVPVDPKKYAAFQAQVQENFRKFNLEPYPEQYQCDIFYCFGEPGISNRLTSGNFPEYWGAPPYELTKEEKDSLRSHVVTARCAAEAIRAKWPNVKILIPYGDPLFVVPLLRAGFPKDLIDGSGLDNCGFERLPEQQLHQVSVHRLYELRKEFAKAGIPNPLLVYCEGIFVPTEPGACSWREQMDIYNRWTLISMAYGVTRFYSGWFAFDCGDYYGAEHYGGCGIQRRIPYCDPKPAYAAFATMTDKLDRANFDGWLPTGSLTTYCLRFKGPKGNVYALWTIRGARPVTLTLDADGEAAVTDAMNNTKVLQSRERKVAFRTDPSVAYVTLPGTVQSVEVGEPDHSDAQPAQGAIQTADLGDGSWNYTSERDSIYETNNFDTFRYPGRFSGEVIKDSERGKVFSSKLEPQETVHELMPWYNTLAPKKPVVLKGAPSAVGLWVKGASDWGRVVYCLRDAKGARWVSVGSKDQWNCDDVHSWASFNFDGWRYLRFELPGNAGYDSYRKYGSTWWRSAGGDGVVALPLTLERIIVEQRSHILYVNDVQPVASDTVCFGKLFIEYDSPEDATKEAVRLSQLRMPMPTGAANLPNPIAEMEQSGLGAPTAITQLEMPAQECDGTKVHVRFQEVQGAKKYFVWVSAHPDGRGAINLTPGGAKSGDMVYGLRPAVEFSFWVVYEDAQGKMSKPSPAAKTVLVDMFKEK